MKRYLMACMILVFITSCSYVISRETREIAVKDVPFKNILDNPDAYINNIFIMGGIIARTTNTDEGTEIEIVQTPVDRLGNIIDRDISEGRFIVTIRKQLDPLIYSAGRDITLAGKLTGSRRALLGTREYNYPVFEVKEMYLWKKERYLYQHVYPYWYDPYYHPYIYYWHDPLWRRPYIYPYPRP
ncbi:MAG: Slp family lipoprotein [Nitrospirota bacterium]